jgi:hypothetical protein
MGEQELIQQLLEALVVCVMRLEWLNDPRSGSTEMIYIKFARKALSSAEAHGYKAPYA